VELRALADQKRAEKRAAALSKVTTGTTSATAECKESSAAVNNDVEVIDVDGNESDSDEADAANDRDKLTENTPEVREEVRELRGKCLIHTYAKHVFMYVLEQSIAILIIIIYVVTTLYYAFSFV
jgi:hypothetical protein